jgi:protein-S-isoprenylcysteine O-methyltransferase Ste14
MPMRKFRSYLLVVLQLGSMGVIAASGPLIPAGTPARFLVVGGVLLGIWALLAMEISNYQILPDVRPGARFVTRGPYRWIRHPMYTAVLLLTLGWLLGALVPWRVGVWGVHAMVILGKLTIEERMLLDHFDGYAGYTRRTKRLIPFLF